MVRRTLLALLAQCIIVFTPVSGATNEEKAPHVWFEDNNLAIAGGLSRDFKERFLSPEKWPVSRDHIQVHVVRASSFLKVANQIDDTFLSQYFIPVLLGGGIRLVLDVQGATGLSVKPGIEGLMQRELDLVDRLLRLGAPLSSVALQSVLSKTVVNDQSGQPYEYTDEQRVADVVRYTRELNSRFPKIGVGIIDARPTHGKSYETIYREVARSIRLRFLVLDCPYDYAGLGENGMAWAEVRKVRNLVKELRARFGITLTSQRGGKSCAEQFHQDVVAMAADLQSHRIRADFMMFTAWYPYPETTIPENATENNYPALRTLLEAIRANVPRRAPP